jgi:chorismate mutase
MVFEGVAMRWKNQRRQVLFGMVVLPWWLLGGCTSMPAALPPAQQQAADHLLQLMDQRLAVATKVAQAKWNSGAPIDDPVRERQILDKLTAQLPSADEQERDAVRRFFQAQFDAGKIIQRDLHAQWRQQQRGRFSNPPDLARDIRPALDQLTPQLLAALHQVRPLLPQAAMRLWLQQRSQTLLARDAGAEVCRVALSGLLDPV